MDAIKARELIERYNQGLCTADEKRLVEAWEEELEAGADIDSDEIKVKEWKDAVYASLLERILPNPVLQPVHHVHFMRRWGWAAAVLLLAVGMGTYLVMKEKLTSIPSVENRQPDIAPGKSGAVLTLADGKQVSLDSMGNGIIASQQGADVRLNNGQVEYNGTATDADKMVYNTITTPRGRQFRLTLPDGTQVWLNAASSLRFPTIFLGADRMVEVTGEAYFEVAKNDKMPFNVLVNKAAMVHVLGTHFNINAYTSEQAVKTTLLEGSLAVTYEGQRALLKPGQQANVKTGTGSYMKVTADVNLDKVMAWKNGIFNFEGATLNEFMLQLERWYDIDVVYEKGIPDITFWGKMSRDIPLSGLLVVLEKSNVKFRLDGRKLTILP